MIALFGFTHKAINSMRDLLHSWTVCKLFFSKITSPFPQTSHECALKLTDLWNTSLLFDLNSKFINGTSLLALPKSMYQYGMKLIISACKTKGVQMCLLKHTYLQSIQPGNIRYQQLKQAENGGRGVLSNGLNKEVVFSFCEKEVGYPIWCSIPTKNQLDYSTFN